MDGRLMERERRPCGSYEWSGEGVGCERKMPCKEIDTYICIYLPNY